MDEPGSQYALSLEEIGSEDVALVGGKSANLGELAGLDVPVLPGFTTTSAAYDRYLAETDVEESIAELLDGLDPDDVPDLQGRGRRIRALFESAEMPADLERVILDRYRRLASETGEAEPVVAVRSSATAEDLPTASFAGQQETFLNVSGERELLEAVKGCYASLFTDRAITYRVDRGFDHFAVKLACVVQVMGRADRGCSGIAFTIDPDTGFRNAVVIEASYGLGELIVQGEVTPDRYVVFKPTNGIIERTVGSKERRMVRRDGRTAVEPVPDRDRDRVALSDERIASLATYARRIEDHFGRPMDIEWLLDGVRDELYVVQARPETVHGGERERSIRTYRRTEDGEVLVEGVAIGTAIGAGPVRILSNVGDMGRFERGDVLVTGTTDPDWEPVMRKAAAIVTERGGKTSHAAIVSRELGIPAIVGAESAVKVLRDGEPVTVDCTEATGRVFEGELPFEVHEQPLEEIPGTETDVTLILGDPSRAFSLSRLPVDGVGLAREEFIVTSAIGDHPLYAIERGESERFVEELRAGIAKIAAAFHPRDVVVRLSDFKSDEYRNLRGGARYEPEESNPMLGWRGASRYYDPDFRDAFRLECEALRRVREEVGLDNVIVLVPFCRTPEEGRRVLEVMREFGLDTDGMDVYVMAELPSNVVLADRFAEVFDGFSIGSNDLTQLVLGIDRNSAKLAPLFREDDEAVERSTRALIESAHEADCRVGICGDAPSTVPGYVEFLLEADVDSIAVTPDVALQTIVRVAELESDL
ncbi:phosphoenolpyruvate synthase [Halorarum salinum]|uniref:Phosphoenolpyruvate synthase n=1 Tax=Halorarum salinum TaxID=2743089 RepID=A0A7D5QK42_9EURY|nr:phosphoenolpyruvate synthase [Halobaculum salinum]QLG61865.1 phosphoenolpyruvate synthase [Halobaculum salinum]